jgi:hypothetical protein
MDKATALEIARRGDAYLRAMLLSSGRFVYQFDPRTGTIPEGYNVIRHSGTAWAMLRLLRETVPAPVPPALLEPLKIALRWLMKDHLKPHAHGLCIVENDRAALGAPALTVLALAELQQIEAQAIFLQTAIGLGQYMLAQRKEDGDFVHLRRYGGDIATDTRSDYYPGEALFALTRLHEIDGNPRWLEAVEGSAAKLMARDYGIALQSHWMLYALERLHAARPQSAYLEHARRIVAEILAKPDYRARAASTPIACRSEGLLCFLRMAPADALARPALAALEENLALQARFQHWNGGFVAGAQSQVIRIDYVQHSMASFLGYALLDAVS